MMSFLQYWGPQIFYNLSICIYYIVSVSKTSLSFYNYSVSYQFALMRFLWSHSDLSLASFSRRAFSLACRSSSVTLDTSPRDTTPFTFHLLILSFRQSSWASKRRSSYLGQSHYNHQQKVFTEYLYISKVVEVIYLQLSTHIIECVYLFLFLLSSVPSSVHISLYAVDLKWKYLQFLRPILIGST